MQIGLIFGQESQQGLVLKNSPLYGLTRYTNSNFTKDLDNYKSVMGYCFFLNRAVVSCCSKKQRIVFILTIKAKYIALSHRVRKAI